MGLIVKNDTLEKYTGKLEQYLTNKIEKQSMYAKKISAKEEVVEKLIKYNAEHPGPFPEYPQIKRVDWYVPGDERDINSIKVIQEVSKMNGYEGYASCVVLIVNGSLKRRDPNEDTQLNKSCDELRELMKPFKTEEREGAPSAPWKRKELWVYLKYPNRR